MSRSRGGLATALAALVFAAAGCTPPAATPPPSGAPANPPAQVAAAPAVPSAEPAGDPDDPVRAAQAEIKRMLARVSRARGLPIRRDVPGRVLNREQLLVRIREHVERDIPPDVIAYQGESLAALELIPADYDFLAGMYRLLEDRIAGYYEPADGTMYLVDDLDESEAEETLAHELAHALQDQSFPLEPLLKYAPGDSDRLTAIHALVEGDATSAMLDIVAGSAFNIDEGLLRKLVAISTALSAVGDTPRALQESLVVPYTDGFACVQALRRNGGWPAVDAIWRALPDTTEQLLHPEKLAARERAVNIPAATIPLPEPGFRAVYDDVMGEQGARIVFQEYSHRDAARDAAAGWGGDRIVVSRKDPAAGDAAEAHPAYALAWRLRFDTPADAREAAKVLEGRFGKACRARPQLGPIAWTLRGSDVALVAGPYERAGRAARSAGACAAARRWLRGVVRAPAEAPPAEAH